MKGRHTFGSPAPIRTSGRDYPKRPPTQQEINKCRERREHLLSLPEDPALASISRDDILDAIHVRGKGESATMQAASTSALHHTPHRPAKRDASAANNSRASSAATSRQSGTSPGSAQKKQRPKELTHKTDAEIEMEERQRQEEQSAKKKAKHLPQQRERKYSTRLPSMLHGDAPLPSSPTPVPPLESSGAPYLDKLRPHLADSIRRGESESPGGLSASYGGNTPSSPSVRGSRPPSSPARHQGAGMTIVVQQQHSPKPPAKEKPVVKKPKRIAHENIPYCRNIDKGLKFHHGGPNLYPHKVLDWEACKKVNSNLDEPSPTKPPRPPRSASPHRSGTGELIGSSSMSPSSRRATVFEGDDEEMAAAHREKKIQERIARRKAERLSMLQAALSQLAKQDEPKGRSAIEAEEDREHCRILRERIAVGRALADNIAMREKRKAEAKKAADREAELWERRRKSHEAMVARNKEERDSKENAVREAAEKERRIAAEKERKWRIAQEEAAKERRENKLRQERDDVELDETKKRRGVTQAEKKASKHLEATAEALAQGYPPPLDLEEQEAEDRRKAAQAEAENEAAGKLQGALRNSNARAAVQRRREDRAAVKIQGAMRGNAARQDVGRRRLHEAVRRVQAMLRSRSSSTTARKRYERKEASENAAARVLQSSLRAKEARVDVTKKRHKKKEEHAAATKIQTLERGRVAKKELESRKRTAKAAKTLQGSIRQHSARQEVEARKHEKRLDTATRTVQGALRSKEAREVTNSKRHFANAVVSVQSSMRWQQSTAERGRRLQREVSSMVLQKAARRASASAEVAARKAAASRRTAAATMAQGAMRWQLAVAEAGRRLERDIAALRLQKALRRQSATDDVAARRSSHAASLAEKKKSQLAALTIQRSFRQHRARQELQRRAEEESVERKAAAKRLHEDNLAKLEEKRRSRDAELRQRLAEQQNATTGSGAEQSDAAAAPSEPEEKDQLVRVVKEHSLKIMGMHLANSEDPEKANEDAFNGLKLEFMMKVREAKFNAPNPATPAEQQYRQERVTELVKPVVELLLRGGEANNTNNTVLMSLLSSLNEVDWAGIVAADNLCVDTAVDGSVKFLDTLLGVPKLSLPEDQAVAIVECALTHPRRRLLFADVLRKRAFALRIFTVRDRVQPLWQRFVETLASKSTLSEETEGLPTRALTIANVVSDANLGVDLGVPSADGQTVLSRLCSEGDEDAMSALARLAAAQLDAAASVPDTQNMTPLMFATIAGSTACLDVLLQLDSASNFINATNSTGRTALDIADDEHVDLDVKNTLASAGCQRRYRRQSAFGSSPSTVSTRSTAEEELQPFSQSSLFSPQDTPDRRKKSEAGGWTDIRNLAHATSTTTRDDGFDDVEPFEVNDSFLSEDASRSPQPQRDQRLDSAGGDDDDWDLSPE